MKQANEMIERKKLVKARRPSQDAEGVNECAINECEVCTGRCMKREVKKKRNSLEQMGNVSRIYKANKNGY